MTQPIHPVLERVARAIFKAKFHPDETQKQIDSCWREWDQDRKQAYRAARAAIQALLEPDEGMNGQGANAYIVASLGEVEDAPQFILQAMLKPLLGDEG